MVENYALWSDLIDPVIIEGGAWKIHWRATAVRHANRVDCQIATSTHKTINYTFPCLHISHQMVSHDLLPADWNEKEGGKKSVVWRLITWQQTTWYSFNYRLLWYEPQLLIPTFNGSLWASVLFYTDYPTTRLNTFIWTGRIRARSPEEHNLYATESRQVICLEITNRSDGL